MKFTNYLKNMQVGEVAVVDEGNLEISNGECKHSIRPNIINISRNQEHAFSLCIEIKDKDSQFLFDNFYMENSNGNIFLFNCQFDIGEYKNLQFQVRKSLPNFKNESINTLTIDIYELNGEYHVKEKKYFKVTGDLISDCEIRIRKLL
jgi:hypothetical protein